MAMFIRISGAHSVDVNVLLIPGRPPQEMELPSPTTNGTPTARLAAAHGFTCTIVSHVVTIR